ncbi:MAG: hypothetical protein KJ970_16460 [Candidatus Eisenbacteria bacterium]|uniref:Uncharacterized protein n=1 Tax=Eiseniibacteriota bacterium TaxID=2212470 RepID=A0A948W7E4_UNCEI|nr:hypothetical protein [Candidatus Eisenbacteria bacterium]MBU1949030.1 hypothetical protein [Candidatus Eisenbacteria bacterium]MBU2692514.1 hypothetical protein [Candidatus Eisenbacteria bacterium]
MRNPDRDELLEKLAEAEARLLKLDKDRDELLEFISNLKSAFSAACETHPAKGALPLSGYSVPMKTRDKIALFRRLTRAELMSSRFAGKIAKQRYDFSRLRVELGLSA